MMTSRIRQWARESSRVLGVFTLGLVMALSLAITGCGGGPKTLEDYMNTDEGKEQMAQIQEQADSMSSFGSIKVDIKDNNIIYDVTIDQTFDENPFSDSTFSDSDIDQLKEAIADLEEETGISGCTMEYIFRDKNSDVLYQATISANGLNK